MFRDPGAYWRMFAYGHVGVLEAYFDGQLDIEGSLAKTLAAGMEGGMDQRGGPLIWLRNRWHELTHSNSARSQARANAEAHYALPPEFYKFWLDDPLMFYTCAYWTEETRTLEEAQRAKADHVARKVRLQPGEEVVDVGSGFGGFLMHAAMHYGVRITSINTTGSQADHARRQIEKFGIKNAVQMHADFRGAHAPRARFLEADVSSARMARCDVTGAEFEG